MSAEIKKRGLGRGLDALFQDAKREEAAFEPKLKRGAEFPETAQEIKSGRTGNPVANLGEAPRKIAVEKLTPGKFQPRLRFDESAIDQLAESIAIHGVLQPLLVRPLSGGRYEIIAGERRWRAAQKAQVHELPVVIRELSDTETLEIALIENLQREDLSAIEEAEGYQRLMDEFGHTQEMLSRQLGKSRSHVANTLRLLKLPESVRGLIQNGKLSAGHARALVGAKNPLELAQVIVKRDLSVRETERLVKKATEGKLPKKKKPAFVQKDVDILALEEKMTALLGMRVSIEQQAQGGSISVAFKTLDQLDDVLARLSTLPQRG